jgi:poly-gamma-glutamate synthesis protein (capsule biosynthesis protein)
MTQSVPVRLVAVGDIMLGRGVKTAPVPDAAQLLSPKLSRALEGDIVTGNLECLIGSEGTPSPASHSHFQGDPDFARPLVSRFHVVTVANNHIGDFGDHAIAETLTWLDAIGVARVGVGKTIEEATAPAVFDIRGQKVAVFGATTVANNPASSAYKLASPGQELYRRAAEYQKAGHTCILHLHTGGGDVCHPAPAVRRLMQEVQVEGFTIVFGHHPHVLQGFDLSPRCSVFYSMGDFLFDKLEGGRDQALVVTAYLPGDGSADPIDIDIVQRSPDLQLSLLSGEARRQRLQELGVLSEMIASGASDDAYVAWRGRKLSGVLRSIRGDFRAGGWRALWAKLGRINKRKMVDLVFRR